MSARSSTGRTVAAGDLAGLFDDGQAVDGDAALYENITGFAGGSVGTAIVDAVAGDVDDGPGGFHGDGREDGIVQAGEHAGEAGELAAVAFEMADGAGKG